MSNSMISNNFYNRPVSFSNVASTSACASCGTGAQGSTSSKVAAGFSGQSGAYNFSTNFSNGGGFSASCQPYGQQSGYGNSQNMMSMLLQMLQRLMSMMMTLATNQNGGGWSQGGCGQGGNGGGSVSTMAVGEEGNPGGGNGGGSVTTMAIGEEGNPGGGNGGGSVTTMAIGEEGNPGCGRPPEPPACKNFEVKNIDREKGTATINLGKNYTLELAEDKMSWTLKNNCTGKSTKVWGDPHVDENADGKNDWDFKKNGTFVLEDGTKISVKTVPHGNSGATVSSELTITNSRTGEAMVVKGLAGSDDGARNLSIEDKSGQARQIDAQTDDGAFYVYENREHGWSTDKGENVTQDWVNKREA